MRSIGAPEASSAALTACFSVRLTPSAGAARSAAGDQGEHEIAFANACEQREHA
jgi:hypothetical protein